jgi:cobalt-zinc-cadmium efflux system outer membrane protein
MRRTAYAAAIAALLLQAPVRAADLPITHAQAVARAAAVAPDIAVGRAREGIARAEVGIAGILPNPALIAGSSTEGAKLSVAVSVPLVVLGQRRAATDAGWADLAASRVATEATEADVRAAVGHAFVALWRAQGLSAERDRAASVAGRLDEAVGGRVELGASASVDGLRAHAQRLLADAGAREAAQLVVAAASELGRWLRLEDAAALRADGDPLVPREPPSLSALREHISTGPVVRRERAEAHAAGAHAAAERALARPTITVEVGLDAWDPTLCPGPGSCTNPPVNYRGLVGVELPILNQRGPYVDRALATAAAARSREEAETTRLTAFLATAYRTFEAWAASARVLSEGVVAAADAAAAATEESYTLGRAPLVAVLDAEKARIDARLSLLDARAAQADAWIEVEHAVGVR